jgi:Leucine-rich repeat (LRR) protein
LLNRSSVFSKYKSNDFYISQLRLFLEAGKEILNPFELILSHAKITNCLAAGCEFLEASERVDFLEAMDAYQSQKEGTYPIYKLQQFATANAGIYTPKAYDALEILAKIPIRAYEHSISKLSAENTAAFWGKISLSADSLEGLNIYYELAFPTAAIRLNKLKILDLNQNLADTLPDWVWELPSLEYIVFSYQSPLLAIATSNGFELKKSPTDDKFSLYVGSPLKWWVGKNIYYFQKMLPK